jgi:predicted aspartyl protease
MSVFKTEVTLTNARDIGNAEVGIVPKRSVRSLTLMAKPDTAAWTLVINEKTRLALGLLFKKGEKSASLADGSLVPTQKTEPVEIRWKNRSTSMEAIVLPNARNILLGALPLEALDVVVDPVHECLRGAHGEKPAREL